MVHPGKEKTMTIKVKNGTPLYGASLCQTCDCALIIKGYREGEHTIICQSAWPSRQILYPVRECTGYVANGRESLCEMRKIAWELLPRGPKGQAGFAGPPTQEKDEEISATQDGD
jgi:hypothetical protein